MQSDDSMWDFHVDGNTVLTNLLVSLKKILASRHQQRPSKSSSEFDPLNIKAEIEGNAMLETILQHTSLIDDRIQEYNKLNACLQDHRVILGMIKKALDSSEWPKDDTANP